MNAYQYQTVSKNRPRHIPIETRDELPYAYQPQEDSLSPIKDKPKQTHLNIKLNKLCVQTKTRSIDDELEVRPYVEGVKPVVKRSTSAKFRNPKLASSDLLQSPNQADGQSFNLANQNPAFGLKPSYPADTNIPVSNYGYGKRYQNISEESNESGFYTNSQHSTNSAHDNQNTRSEFELIEEPKYANEVPFLTTGLEDRNLHELPLEQTLRANFTNEPIYENFPIRFVNHNQSNSFLQDEVMRLRDIVSTFGNVNKMEQIHKQLKSQQNSIMELELKNEKLRRDNEILKIDSSEKEQINQTNKMKISHLLEQNSHLFEEMKQLHSIHYPTNRIYPPKQPPKYLAPPHDDTIRQYEPIRSEMRTRSDPPIPDPRRLNLNADTNNSPSPDLQQRNLTPRLVQSEYRVPRSMPTAANLNLANIPLNPHSNGNYPASHDPTGTR